MEEFSFSAQFKQQMFKELREKGLHLENCVYYQGDTHYFVMTPTIGALKAYGVVKKGGDPAKVRRNNAARPRAAEWGENTAGG